MPKVTRLLQAAGVISSIATATVLSASLVLAAVPDGSGPWADSVVSTSQGLMKNGSAVPAIRSNPASALGVAENDTVPGHFYSLGFGGNITLGFENGISDGAFVVEATNPNYPQEKANVSVSEDGVNFVFAGTLTQDGQVSVPPEVSCARYVRITDISNPAIMPDAIADGYDVDGVMAQGTVCRKMTGGGSVFLRDLRVTHGMQLRCDATKKSNLEVNWGKGQNFHLENVTSASCYTNPAIDQGKPQSAFNTHTGTGTGKFNGVDGYKISWTFTDAGEPGKNDTANIHITDSTGSVDILSVVGNLHNGNQQAH